jgi:hypothetical protein
LLPKRQTILVGRTGAAISGDSGFYLYYYRAVNWIRSSISDSFVTATPVECRLKVIPNRVAQELNNIKKVRLSRFIGTHENIERTENYRHSTEAPEVAGRQLK